MSQAHYLQVGRIYTQCIKTGEPIQSTLSNIEQTSMMIISLFMYITLKYNVISNASINILYIH